MRTAHALHREPGPAKPWGQARRRRCPSWRGARRPAETRGSLAASGSLRHRPGEGENGAWERGRAATCPPATALLRAEEAAPISRLAPPPAGTCTQRLWQTAPAAPALVRAQSRRGCSQAGTGLPRGSARPGGRWPRSAFPVLDGQAGSVRARLGPARYGTKPFSRVWVSRVYSLVTAPWRGARFLVPGPQQFVSARSSAQECFLLLS